MGSVECRGSPKGLPNFTWHRSLCSQKVPKKFRAKKTYAPLMARKCWQVPFSTLPLANFQPICKHCRWICMPRRREHPDGRLPPRSRAARKHCRWICMPRRREHPDGRLPPRSRAARQEDRSDQLCMTLALIISHLLSSNYYLLCQSISSHSLNRTHTRSFADLGKCTKVVAAQWTMFSSACPVSGSVCFRKSVTT